MGSLVEDKLLGDIADRLRYVLERRCSLGSYEREGVLIRLLITAYNLYLL